MKKKVYTKHIPVTARKTGKVHYDDRVLFGVYCSTKDAEFIDACLQSMGVTHGRSGMFIRALLLHLESLGFSYPTEEAVADEQNLRN